jgi:hypothetical protein
MRAHRILYELHPLFTRIASELVSRLAQRATAGHRLRFGSNEKHLSELRVEDLGQFVEMNRSPLKPFVIQVSRRYSRSDRFGDLSHCGFVDPALVSENLELMS